MAAAAPLSSILTKNPNSSTSDMSTFNNLSLNEHQQTSNSNSNSIPFSGGGLFLENTIPYSIIDVFSLKNPSINNNVCCSTSRRTPVVVFDGFRRKRSEFMSVSLSVKGSDEAAVGDGGPVVEEEGKKKEKIRVRRRSGTNATRHLWAGAVAAMVSRTCVAPLERLKLEYMVRGEKKRLPELIKSIASSQGLRGFWKGNFVNILRTAPFKAINFYAYDTYRKQLHRLSGNEETTNLERLIAGAAAGMTASILCLPMDTIRTKLVAPGGEALGGVIGAFRHIIQTEGFFSLYKGLVPSIISMGPASAVFYGVYDILKTGYLNSPEGRERIERMKQHSQELNVLEQLELGTVRTLLHGAIAGACAEAATYPFEVVRRQLQLQVRATKLSALATCLKIVEKGGVPALYAGLIPSLLQVLPSAAISYFVYEFMKIALKVE